MAGTWHLRNGPEGERAAGRILRGLGLFFGPLGFLAAVTGLVGGHPEVVARGALIFALSAVMFLVSWHNRWSEHAEPEEPE